jgi:hypothetical protein
MNDARCLGAFSGLHASFLRPSPYPCAGAGDEPGSSQSEVSQDVPPRCVDDEIVDILRALDHPDCRREGTGCPIGECPPGCVGTASPSTAVDVLRECRLTPEEMGGPAVCRTELE